MVSCRFFSPGRGWVGYGGEVTALVGLGWSYPARVGLVLCFGGEDRARVIVVVSVASGSLVSSASCAVSGCRSRGRRGSLFFAGSHCWRCRGLSRSRVASGLPSGASLRRWSRREICRSGRRTAQMLMAVVLDQRLSNSKHASLLPPAWYMLFFQAWLGLG